MSAAVAPNTSRVFFDAPVFEQINPPRTGNQPVQISQAEIVKLTRELRENGIDKSAVVVRRKLFSSGSPSTYDMLLPKNWGFVEDMRTYVATGKDYVPLKVKWVDGSTTDEWPNNLFLIHCAVNYTAMDKCFTEQMKND